MPDQLGYNICQDPPSVDEIATLFPYYAIEEGGYLLGLSIFHPPEDGKILDTALFSFRSPTFGPPISFELYSWTGSGPSPLPKDPIPEEELPSTLNLLSTRGEVWLELMGLYIILMNRVSCLDMDPKYALRHVWEIFQSRINELRSVPRNQVDPENLNQALYDQMYQMVLILTRPEFWSLAEMMQQVETDLRQVYTNQPEMREETAQDLQVLQRARPYYQQLGYLIYPNISDIDLTELEHFNQYVENSPYDVNRPERARYLLDYLPVIRDAVERRLAA